MIKPPRGWEDVPALADAPTAAALLSVPEIVLVKAVAEGCLTALNLSGKLYFKPADVISWLSAAAKNPPTSRQEITEPEITEPVAASPAPKKTPQKPRPCPAATPVPASSGSHLGERGTSHGPKPGATCADPLDATVQQLKRRSPPSFTTKPDRPPLALVRSN